MAVGGGRSRLALIVDRSTYETNKYETWENRLIINAWTGAGRSPMAFVVLHFLPHILSSENEYIFFNRLKETKRWIETFSNQRRTWCTSRLQFENNRTIKKSRSELLIELNKQWWTGCVADTPLFLMTQQRYWTCPYSTGGDDFLYRAHILCSRELESLFITIRIHSFRFL